MKRECHARSRADGTPLPQDDRSSSASAPRPEGRKGKGRGKGGSAAHLLEDGEEGEGLGLLFTLYSPVSNPSTRSPHATSHSSSATSRPGTKATMPPRAGMLTPRGSAARQLTWDRGTTSTREELEEREQRHLQELGNVRGMRAALEPRPRG